MTYGDDPHLGRGWAFPPRWDLPDGAAAAVLATSDGVPHVQEAMRVLLRTGVGARVMRPTLGAGVDRYVFEPRTTDVCYRLAHDVERALLLWEPRVIVDAVEAVPAGEADERIDVRIEYRLDRHSRPDNLVIPFFVAGPS
ncbi:GPW/gp25 family protein [Cellulomonas sp.]|uniref:GPW/gp25 family protein n=1 Tax=Cellulomonas sp. TaxID=40001 RepID=UPI003BA8D813